MTGTGRVLAFNAAVCLLVACLFSLAPVLVASKLDLQTDLRSGRAAGAAKGSTRLFSFLIAGEAALAFLALSMTAAGMLFQSTRPIGFDRAVLSWAAYIPWGLFQQYVLHGYFLNRFDALFSRRAAPLLAATLFSGVHLPNWFLMAVPLLAGYCCARIYRRYQNLYFLGAAHGTIGFLLFMMVPDSITHHLTVGPGWFLH